MLESYFVRPQTVDRIRALWLGPAIEQYVAWLTERRNARSHILTCVATLERFNAFAQGRGARTWDDLPGCVDAFVERQLRERGAWCRTAKDRRTILSQARSPVEQLLRLLVPGFDGHRTVGAMPFAVIVPGFFDHLEHERGLRHYTRQLYAHHLRVFEAHLQHADVAVTNVTPAILTEFLRQPRVLGKALGPNSMQQQDGVIAFAVRRPALDARQHAPNLVPRDRARQRRLPVAAASWDGTGKASTPPHGCITCRRFSGTSARRRRRCT